jgi:hypothetical protein
MTELTGQHSTQKVTNSTAEGSEVSSQQLSELDTGRDPRSVPISGTFKESDHFRGLLKVS